jgi:hypothetical protein
MTKSILYSSALIVIALSLSSCAAIYDYYPTSPVERNWRRSVESMMHHQMAVQETTNVVSRRTSTITGLDPQAAEAIIQKYRDGFEKTRELPAYSGVAFSSGG